MSGYLVNPNKIFESAKDGVCTVKSIFANVAGATNNQQIVAAVTGKRIMVISGNMNGAQNQPSMQFKSGSGGTVLMPYTVPAPASGNPNVKIGPDQFGVFETATGVGLFADNLSAVAGDVINMGLRYIEYTP